MTRETSAIDRIADKWVDTSAELSPSFATYIGRDIGKDKIDDASPEAQATYVAEMRKVLAELATATPTDKVDEVTLDAMRESLNLEVEIQDSGLWTRDLNVIASPAQGFREIFDLSPTATEEDWKNISARLSAIPGAVDGYIRSLREGIAATDTPAARQITWVLNEVKELAGKESFFTKFASEAKAGDSELSSGLKADLERAAVTATEGYAQLAEFLQNELMPKANPADAIGRER